MPPTFTARDCVKAARSAGQNSCVRIGRKGGWTLIWDDKLAKPGTDQSAALPPDQVLMFPDEQFDEFQDGLRVGTTEGKCVRIDQSSTGQYRFTARFSEASQPIALYFDAEEFDAFMDGVRGHEFDLSRFAAAA